jgi:uncharacterized protein (TIGR02001 family)
MSQFSKKVLAAAVLASLSGVAFAEEAKSPVAANISVTNNYVWRGFSQTAKQMALQGGFDYAHGSGFYVGFWGSNVNFGNDGTGTYGDKGAQLEADVYGGYKFKAGPVDLDLGIMTYNYPGSDSALKYNFQELYAGIGWGPVSAKYSYANDFQGTTKDEGHYLEVNGTFEVAKVLNVIAHIGYSFGDGVKTQYSSYSNSAGGSSYIDYKVGVTKDYAGFTFGAAYTGTDVDNEEPAGKVGSAKGMPVIWVARSF